MYRRVITIGTYLTVISDYSSPQHFAGIFIQSDNVKN